MILYLIYLVLHVLYLLYMNLKYLFIVKILKYLLHNNNNNNVLITMSQTIDIALHTILLTIGPSNCGKSYFCKNTLKPLLEKSLLDAKISPNVQYISSDEIRHQLLGNMNLYKYDNKMIAVSRQAFDILKTVVKNCTQFPVNSHYVIIDSTGLNKEFRDEIFKIATDNKYNLEYIVFNFKNIKDYFTFNGANNEIVRKQVVKFREHTLKELTKHVKKIYIKDHSSNYNINITNIDLYMRCKLDNNRKYFIIGDVHECIDELKMLLINIGFKIEDNKIIRTDNLINTDIIFIGDIIDKAGNTKEIIDFIHINMFSNTNINIKLICGNHERAVYNLLVNNTKDSNISDKFINEYYTSYDILKDDKELTTKFLEIYKETVPFLIYDSNNHKTTSFYITHSICDHKFIGKLDNGSIKQQQYTYIDRESDPIKQIKKFINNDNYKNILPLHISGHISLTSPYLGYKDKNNIVMIDTGCAYGNMLTGILLGDNINTPKIYTVKSNKQYTNYETELYSMSNDIDIDKTVQLDPQKYARIQYLLKNKINFISGTVSPADKCMDDNELESLKLGLKYYHDYLKKNNLDMKLILQPKYMGSRANVYLFRDNIDDCFTVSRNGYIITYVDKDLMKNVYTELHTRLNSFMKDNCIKMMIIDGELLPWNALGDQLIEKSFKTVDYAMNSELKFLKESGFDEQYQELLTKYQQSDFKDDSKKMSSKDLQAKYTTNYHTFKELQDESKKHIDTDTLINCAQIFHKQLEIYGSESKLQYKPFNILKILYDNNNEMITGFTNSIIKEVVLGQINMYELLSDDEYHIVDFKDDFDVAYAKAKKFYNNITLDKQMEGIVIKPDLFISNVSPFIKVRNRDYLTIIYGADYLTKHKYEKLLKQKSIKNKLKISIKEFELGLKMLQTKWTDITTDNKSYKNLLTEFLFAEETEKYLDPRL